MRLVYCTSGGLYGALVLARLLANPRVQVAGVVVSTRILNKDYGWLRGALEQVQRTGIPYAFYLWCATDLADLLAGAFSSSPVLPVKQQCAQGGLPMLYTRDINNPAGLGFVRERQVELLVSGFFNQRLGLEVCRLPGLGAVNLHPGALPAYKGVDPVFRAMERGEQEYRISLHRVVDTLDDGPLLAERQLGAAADTSLLMLTARLFCAGADLLLEQLPAIAERAPGQPQQGEGRYDSWPSAADVSSLRRSGRELLSLGDLKRIRQGNVCT